MLQRRKNFMYAQMFILTLQTTKVTLQNVLQSPSDHPQKQDKSIQITCEFFFYTRQL